MNAVKISKVAIPTVTRASKPNPFKGLAETCANDRENAYRYELHKDEKASSVIRLLRKAGADADVSLRILPDDHENPTALTIWAVDKIERPRKK